MNIDDNYKRDPHLRSRTEIFLKHATGDCIEFGCGTGFLLSKISNKLPKNNHIGIDTNTKDIKTSQSRKLKNVIFINSDISLYSSKKHDTIILSHVLEHLQNPCGVLLKIEKNLNPNGKILIMIPNKNGFLNDAKTYPKGQKHFHIFDRSSIKFMLKQLGFTCDFKNTTIRFPFTRRLCLSNSLISDIAFIILKKIAVILPSLSYDLFIIAKKVELIE